MAEIYFDASFNTNYIRFGHGSKSMIVIPGIYYKRLVPLADALEKQCEAFCNDFTVYVVERRNVLSENATVAEMAEDVASVMVNCGISKAFLYGVSQGGVIVQLIAAKHPELVQKAVIVSSSSRINTMLRDVINAFIDNIKAGRLDLLGEIFAEKLFMPETIKNFPALKTIDPNISKIDLNNFEIMARNCLYMETEDILDQIHCPVLVISGRLDKVYGYEESSHLAKRLNCRHISYENFGHAVYDECPDVLKAVYDFFMERL